MDKQKITHSGLKVAVPDVCILSLGNVEYLGFTLEKIACHVAIKPKIGENISLKYQGARFDDPEDFQNLAISLLSEISGQSKFKKPSLDIGISFEANACFVSAAIGLSYAINEYLRRPLSITELINLSSIQVMSYLKSKEIFAKTHTAFHGNIHLIANNQNTLQLPVPAGSQITLYGGHNFNNSKENVTRPSTSGFLIAGLYRLDFNLIKLAFLDILSLDFSNARDELSAIQSKTNLCYFGVNNGNFLCFALNKSSTTELEDWMSANQPQIKPIGTFKLRQSGTCKL